MPRGVVLCWFDSQGYGFIILDVLNAGSRYADDVFSTGMQFKVPYILLKVIESRLIGAGT